MSRSVHIVASCLAVIFGVVGVVTAAAPATAPAPTLSKAQAKAAADAAAVKKLAAYIQVIKTSKDPSVVLRAYTRASSLDRMNMQLNSAYMRRMLQLGRPQAAYVSAKILSTQDVDAGLAWAMIGYTTGRSGNYRESIIATARALEFNSDDESIMNNAGQMAAWFDNAKFPPKVGDREKRIMARLAPKFKKSKAYTDAYKRVSTMYATCKQDRSGVETRLLNAQKEYNKVRTSELTMRATLKRLGSQFHQLSARLKKIEKDIRQNRNNLNLRDEHGRQVYDTRAILAENSRLEKERDAAKKKQDELKKEATPLGPKVRLAEAKGKMLRKEVSECNIALKKLKPAILKVLRWDPPSVDGVFTEEAPGAPKVSNPTTKPAPTIMTTDDEAKAAKRYKMAKLYISNDKDQRAREIILEILTKYPKTKTATQARELLKSISPQ
ncbi:MAG: hypothetical protein HN350_17165 [Phycisphaerales bacterium]|nr:hypothetical protein [Phycisphaerales bacterium]